jgi:hypothetical protein
MPRQRPPLTLKQILARQAVKLAGYTTGHVEVPISEAARKTLRSGANILAVSCKQTGGGQYIDVGLVELKRWSIF